MMNLFQRDSQQSSGEMHWVVLRAEQKLQVWAPEHWSAHQHFVASFESFICCFQSLQPVFLVQFLKRLPAHTPWLPPLLRLPWDFNFRSISMYQTHLHTHFSHLGHAFERLKHLFWFGLSKVQAINSAGYVFHDKLIIMPSSHLRALPGEIKWKKWLNYLYWLLIKRYYACLVEKQCLCCISLRVKVHHFPADKTFRRQCVCVCIYIYIYIYIKRNVFGDTIANYECNILLLTIYQINLWI